MKHTETYLDEYEVCVGAEGVVHTADFFKTEAEAREYAVRQYERLRASLWRSPWVNIYERGKLIEAF